MLPTPKSAHIDAALTNMSIGYSNQMYIGDRVFPNVPVKKQSDYFFKFLKGDWFRNAAKVRGAGGNAPRGGYKLTSDTYSCLERAFAHEIPIELLNNADDVLQPLNTAVNFVTNQIQLAKEIAVATLCRTAANWTSSEDAAGGWAATASTNTFIVDVLTARITVKKLIGVKPNCLLIDDGTMNELKQCDDIIDRIKYTGTQGKPADVTKQTLAALLELDEVLVGEAIYSTDEETLAGTEFTAADLWETNATKGMGLLYYRPPKPSIETPAAGYCFNWKGDAGQASQLVKSDVYRTVRKWWEDSPKQWVVEASESFNAKVTCADAGFLFYDTIST